MNTKTIKDNKYTLNMVKTDKFKTVRIQLSFGNDLSIETIAIRSMIPYLLRAVSKTYDTRKSMSSHLENMYAAHFNVGVSKVAKSHFISFDFSVINDQYSLEEDSLFDKSLEFLNEILFNPFFNEQTFLEEKRLLKEYFSGIYTNKLKYAFKEMQNIMFKDEIYRINALGDKDILEDVTLEQCISGYQDMLNNDLITINVVGDIDFDFVEKDIKKAFNFNERSKDLVLIDNEVVIVDNVKEIFNKIDVNQAKLIIGYRFDSLYHSNDYFDAIVFNTLFGGSSEGLLFREIRENLGLVYFIGSSYDPYKGVVFLTAGINQTDYQKVLTTVDSILEKIIAQDYDDSLLDILKSVQVNNLIESLDSNGGLSSRINRDSLFNDEFNPDKIIVNLKSVTKDGISSVAKKLIKDTIYLLRDDKDE